MWRRRGPRDDEFREEIEAHIALETDRLIAEGCAPDEAATTARQTFGNTTLVRERYHERHRIGWLTDFGRDVAYAARALRRSPGFVAAAVLTLAIGLGANAVVFSAVNAVLLRPLPYANAESLVLVEHPPLGQSPEWLRTAWRERSRSLVDFAGYQSPSAATLQLPGGPVPVVTTQVTSNFFSLLGASTIVGRGFTEVDARAEAPALAVLSHAAWRRYFNADPAVVGSSTTHVLHDRETLTIVGVLPPEFRFPLARANAVSSFGADRQPDIIRLAAPDEWVKVIGRLSPGTTAEVATDELFGILRQGAGEQNYGRMVDEGRLTLTTTSLKDRLVGETSRQLLLLMGAVACVLLIVCANVANLMVARASTRQAEFAVRTALGAGTGRLVRLILAESLLLASLGATTALGFAIATAGLVQSVLVSRVSYIETIRVDWAVLTFGVIVATATGIVSGLASVPAVRAKRLGNAMAGARARQATARTGLGRTLLTVEVAATFVLVVAAALLAQTLWNLHHTDAGFDADGLATAAIMPAASGTIPELQRFTSGFFGDLTRRVQALPAVESAAAASIVPLGPRSVGMAGVSLVGREGGPAASVSVAAVTPGYFETVGTRLLAGREFSDRDGEGAELVAIVNNALWLTLANEPPRVGDRVQFGKRQLLIVGVARDFPSSSLRESPTPFVYMPLAQSVGGNIAWGRLTVLARVRAGDPAALLPALREVVWTLGHDIVVDEVTTMDERVQATLRSEHDAAWLYGLLAVVALAVAAAGAFGVVGYAVARRTREIGIRMALGATTRDAQRLVLRQVLAPTLIGTGIGVVVAAGVTDLLESMVFGVTPLDPMAFLMAGVVLVGSVLFAAYLPSRRAARIDPIVALRAE